MAIIAQKLFFEWKDLENLGDLQRLKYVLDNIPDKKIIRTLNTWRNKGRNDFNVVAMWNSILAGIVFQHESIESLRRELLRNRQLRIICGFDDFFPAEIVIPNSWNYSRFLKNLIKCYSEIEDVFNQLIQEIIGLLPDFGNFLAHDGKAIETYAVSKSKEAEPSDGRRDTDADIGTKKYSGITKEGKLWKKIKSWFGYKLHLIIDAKYELPVAFDLTKASEAETPKAHQMIDYLAEKQPEIIKRAEYFTSDRGNDDVKLITKLWDKHKIKPIIDIRNMWKDPDSTKGLSTGENVIYNYKGDIFCVCPKSGDIKSMMYGGYEKDRNGHKYLCPAIYKGIECKGKQTCELFTKKYVRINMKEDARIFVPVARSSYKWKKLYKMRTSVERVNSRVDHVFCFEKHYIKGQKKMKLRLSLAFIVMLAMAIGKIKDNKMGCIGKFTKIA